MKIINLLSVLLVIIGAINWGFVGIFKFNILEFLFKENSIISRLIYTLIGIAGLYTILYLIF